MIGGDQRLIPAPVRSALYDPVSRHVTEEPAMPRPIPLLRTALLLATGTALAGVAFVLRTGCPWRLLPKELGCGSGTTR